VRGVETAFEPLQPVALLNDLADVPVRLQHLCPGEFRQRRDLLGRTHIGPDEAAQFAGRISSYADLVLELVFLRLVHLVDTTAVDGEFPAVINATQPALLVAPEPQRGAAMWTIFVEEPDPAVAVAERDEILAQQPDAHRRTVGPGDLARQQRRDPIATHRLAHRRSRAGSGSAARFPHGTAWSSSRLVLTDHRASSPAGASLACRQWVSISREPSRLVIRAGRQLAAAADDILDSFMAPATAPPRSRTANPLRRSRRSRRRQRLAAPRECSYISLVNIPSTERRGRARGAGKPFGIVGRMVATRGGAAVARVFITGSSDGLGLMAARLLIEQGHEVVLHGRNEGAIQRCRASVAS